MKVVLLAGGKGTRITEESEYRPKPLIEVGGMPILWHVMKEYSYYGFNDFIICAGYKQEKVKQWFAKYFLRTSDITFDYTKGNNDITVHHSRTEPWKVTIVDTGLETMTGGRIKRIQEYIEEDTFMMTYGDGVCDIDLQDLLKFHENHGKIATLTAVTQKESKGTLDIGRYGAVRFFREKKIIDSKPINAGYMVLNKEIFDYLKDDKTVLEQGPLERLAEEGQLMSYQHNGFWQCMDTLLEKQQLEQMMESGTAPWKKW